VRWVGTDEQARAAAEFLGEHRDDRLWVMPFLDGVSCSIHGFVLPGGVAALRPVELLVLRRTPPATSTGSCTPAPTCWDAR
jgi:hypothetical protein